MFSLSNLLKLLEGEYVENENQQMFGFFLINTSPPQLSSLLAGNVFGLS